MSNLINKTRLQKFAEGLWTKIKERYDDAFVNAEITQSTDTEKKIKFTKKKGGATVDVDLADYARLQDRNKFKQDVSVNDAGTANNLHIGTINGNQSNNRILGYRGLTSASFVDNYVSELIVYAKDDLVDGTTTNWNVWAIKKGARKEEDTVKATFHKSNVAVESISINGRTEKCVRFTIDREFDEEVYFMARCTNQQVKTCIPTPAYTQDVVNLSSPPSNTAGQTFSWDTNNTGNTAIMHLVGRESITSLAEKIRKTQADGSNYVLQSETTATGGAGSANKVVKLDEQGKLNKDMLPSIAINDYFSVTAFTDEQLRRLTYENGDVVVVENGGVVSKRYLCIHKGATNSTTEFVELNSKDGVVQSVNGKVGAITLGLEATDNKVKLNIGNGTDTTETAIDIISDDEINSILNALQ